MISALFGSKTVPEADKSEATSKVTKTPVVKKDGFK
jgi:hypothetical protein